jgi:CubicO group peptidase (beta-lactamase class C family)
MTSETLSAINVGAGMLGCVWPCLWSAILTGVLLLVPASFSRAGEPSARFPGKTWEKKTPGEVGLDETKLNAFIKRLTTPAKSRSDGPTKDGPDFCGCVIKDGYMVASWGEPSHKFSWFSASKPVLSTLLFYAIQEGKLKGVDDKVTDWAWKLSEKDKPMTFAHLANQTSGYTLKEPPGTAWAYNDYAILLYASTLDRVFGGKGLNEPAAALFKDLQLEDGDPQKGYGVVTSPRDFARIGWFWMHKGNWKGQQVLGREFFERYMKPQVPRDLPRSGHTEPDDYLGIGTCGGGNNQCQFGPGLYGFNWWFNAPIPKTGGLYWPAAPPDTFAALGWGGNYMIMIPSRNLLVAARGYWGREDTGDPNSRFNRSLELLLEAAKQ